MSRRSSQWLLERLELGRVLQPECALCGLEQGASQRFLEGIAGDGVNDVATRRRFAARGGFCPEHSRRFVDLAHLLSAAILLEDVLAGRLARALRGGRPRPLRCGACQVETEALETALEVVRRALPSGELEAALEGMPVCLPHLERLSPAIPPRLRRVMGGRYVELGERLAEVIRKHDYRFNREQLSDDERESVRRALTLLHGRNRV